MQEIDALEAKNTFGSLLHRVQAGEEFVITRHCQPIARLVRAEGGIDREVAKAASERIRARAKQAGMKFDWAEIKADRDEGRP